LRKESRYGLLDCDLAQFTGFHLGQRSLEFWNEWAEELNLIPLRDKYDDRDRPAGHGLLILELLVDGDKHLEPRLRQGPQLAILLTRPTHLGHGSNVVARQFLPQTLRDALVKQQSHGR
jgi:hypothetical protein